MNDVNDKPLRFVNASDQITKQIVAVGALIIRNGKILLGKRLRKPGIQTYAWCGGYLELGETPEQCAKREVMEETRLKVDSLTLLWVDSFIEDDIQYIDIEYLADAFQGEPYLVEPEKVENWNWYDLEDLPFPLFPKCIETLEKYKSKYQPNK